MKRNFTVRRVTGDVQLSSLSFPLAVVRAWYSQIHSSTSPCLAHCLINELTVGVGGFLVPVALCEIVCVVLIMRCGRCASSFGLERSLAWLLPLSASFVFG